MLLKRSTKETPPSGDEAASRHGRVGDQATEAATHPLAASSAPLSLPLARSRIRIGSGGTPGARACDSTKRPSAPQRRRSRRHGKCRHARCCRVRMASPRSRRHCQGIFAVDMGVAGSGGESAHGDGVGDSCARLALHYRVQYGTTFKLLCSPDVECQPRPWCVNNLPQKPELKRGPSWRANCSREFALHLLVNLLTHCKITIQTRVLNE